MAASARHRQARHRSPVASTRVSVLLALEESAARTRSATHPARRSSAHPPDVPRQPDLGRPAHPRRAAETRYRDRRSHGRALHGASSAPAVPDLCDWPNEIRHSRSVQGSTTSHRAIGAGRCEARGWRSAYFSQPILEGDRSLFSPVPSPPVSRQRAQSANSLGNWRARQDSNLRPPA